MIISIQGHVNAICKGTHPLYRTETVLDYHITSCQSDIWLYSSFGYFHWPVYFHWQMPFLAPTLDNDDPLFPLAIQRSKSGSALLKESARFISAPRRGGESRPS